jgi:hypothetical protein
VEHQGSMWSTAMLAPPPRPSKPDRGRQLEPVNCIEPSVLWADWHKRISLVRPLNASRGGRGRIGESPCRATASLL